MVVCCDTIMCNYMISSRRESEYYSRDLERGSCFRDIVNLYFLGLFYLYFYFYTWIILFLLLSLFQK